MASSDESESVAIRRDKYRRRLANLTYIASGLGVLLTVFSAVKFGEAQPSHSSLVLGSILLTIAILCGIAIALSIGKIQWQLDLINRYLGKDDDGRYSGPAAPISLVMSMKEAAAALKSNGFKDDLTATWPYLERSQYRTSVVLELGVGALLLVYVWLPVPSRRPAPSPAAPVLVELGLPFVTIHFESGQATIPSDQLPLLGTIGKALSADSSKCLRVEGHADVTGSEATNRDLSYARAQLTAAVLVSAGMPQSRLRLVPFGESHPRTTTRSGSALAQNRRVDIATERCPASSVSAGTRQPIEP